MIADPFGAPSHGELFATAEMRAMLSDDRRCAAMVQVEIALAKAQAECGLIPDEAAQAIEDALTGFAVDAAALGTGTEAAGVPVPALVGQLRKAVGGDAAQWIHWGATSQDILDTAQALLIRDVLACFETALDRVITALGARAEEHAGTVILARTRMQQAAPTTFGLKVAGWREPLLRNQNRLEELRPRLLVVQLGGAAGTLAPLGAQGQTVRERLATELGLGLTAIPWHSQRDSLVEFADWLALMTGALGKIGLDVGLLAQSEVGEVRETGEAGRGGSSTLPQKSNPVSSEILVTLARYNAHAVGAMHQAMLYEGERSGSAWSLEWLTLPNMILALSGSLAQGERLVRGVLVNRERMIANIEATNGLCLAEAIAFALSKHMPRADAQALVTQKCREAIDSGRHLVDLLSVATDAPVDWNHVRRPENWLGSAEGFIETSLTEDR
jgi:3-carboxy-cis,cis-muconate cycloisomerase